MIHHTLVRSALVMLCAAGCYTGTTTAHEINAAWRGRQVRELEHRWGAPGQRNPTAQGVVLRWSHDVLHVRGPSGGAQVSAEPVTVGGSIATPIGGGAIRVQTTLLRATAAVEPGEVWTTTDEVVLASIDPRGVIAQVDGDSLRWGPPNDENLHWGVIFGMHAGMGRLDTTSTPLPSGGMYIGGMLSKTLGLVGTFSLATGKDDAGGAMGFAWGLAAQYWPVNRFSLRAGPAMLLTLDPGFTDAALHPGITTSASYALLKIGVFALDLRVDLAAGTSVAFGSVGFGVNVN